MRRTIRCDGKLLSPERRRRAVVVLQERYRAPECQACRVVGQHRSTQRHSGKADSLVEELLAFSPRGGVDDQVDAFCQGVLWIEAQYWRGRGHSSAPLPMVFSR